MCIEAGLSEDGLKHYVTNHGLSFSMVSLLIEAGQTDSTIILRTGHTNTNALARYHIVLGAEFLKQQTELFKVNSTNGISAEGQGFLDVALPSKKTRVSQNNHIDVIAKRAGVNHESRSVVQPSTSPQPMVYVDKKDFQIKVHSIWMQVVVLWIVFSTICHPQVLDRLL